MGLQLGSFQQNPYRFLKLKTFYQRDFILQQAFVKVVLPPVLLWHSKGISPFLFAFNPFLWNFYVFIWVCPLTFRVNQLPLLYGFHLNI